MSQPIAASAWLWKPLAGVYCMFALVSAHGAFCIMVELSACADCLLLPVMASTVATAAGMLAHLHPLQPAPPAAVAALLEACCKSLAQCVDALDVLLSRVQAIITPWVQSDTDASVHAGKRSAAREARAHIYALTGALLAAKHSCGPGGLDTCAALGPLGFDAGNPVATLKCCSQRCTQHPEMSALLLSLAQHAPAALLDATNAGQHNNAPAPWNLRWALIAGSLADLALGTAPQAAPFWRALLDTSAATALDLWGGGRSVDTAPVNADRSGFVWVSWLAAALLSGLWPDELAACPQLVSQCLQLPHVQHGDGSLHNAVAAACGALRGTDVVSMGSLAACAALAAMLAACAAPAAARVCIFTPDILQRMPRQPGARFCLALCVQRTLGTQCSIAPAGVAHVS